MRTVSRGNTYSVRKWGGRDDRSWAVFRAGEDEPVADSLTKEEAQDYRDQLQSGRVAA